MDEVKKKDKKIYCHPDLMEILEKLRKKHTEFTYGYANISYYELTGILAKKINDIGIK